APGELVASYEPTGSVFRTDEASLEYFLVERYCLYTSDEEGHVRRLDIHHRPWLLQPAKATFLSNTMTTPIHLRLPDSAPLLHFAKRQDTVAWAPKQVHSTDRRDLH